MIRYFVEGIGAFFLVLTIGLSNNPIAIGVILAAMIYMGGYISGAHYNPAVTLAVYLQKKIEQKEALLYIVAQVIGAIVASLVFQLIEKRPLIIQPGSTYDFTAAMLVEILFTFALCSVVLHTALSKKNTPNQFYGLAIGMTVMAGAFSVGAISGGAFNPAVGVGPALANIANLSENTYEILLYILGPGIGAILASLLYTHITSKLK